MMTYGATKTDVDHFCDDADDNKASIFEQLYGSCTGLCIENKPILQYFNIIQTLARRIPGKKSINRPLAWLES